jgi:hypothetical protein
MSLSNVNNSSNSIIVFITQVKSTLEEDQWLGIMNIWHLILVLWFYFHEHTGYSLNYTGLFATESSDWISYSQNPFPGVLKTVILTTHLLEDVSPRSIMTDKFYITTRRDDKSYVVLSPEEFLVVSPSHQYFLRIQRSQTHGLFSKQVLLGFQDFLNNNM